MSCLAVRLRRAAFVPAPALLLLMSGIAAANSDATLAIEAVSNPRRASALR
jgi:hypothetical protein